MEHHFELLYEWVYDCIQKARKCSPYPTGEDTSKALWRTLNGNTIWEELISPFSCDRYLDYLQEIRLVLAKVREMHAFVRTKAIDSPSEVIFEAAISRLEQLTTRLHNLGKACATKIFAVTRKKYMGLVPQDARTGDLVCVMYGCESPFIIRKSRGKTFEFIGHASVYGLDFESAVATTNVQGGQCRPQRRFDIETEDEFGRHVYVTFRRTRNFALV